MEAKHRPMLTHFKGLVIGTAVGDSLGLPAEGMSRKRIHRRWRGIWKQRLIFGCGMVSDDTEHMVFVAQALLAHPDNLEAFQRCLAWKLRLWLLGLPAGIGLATLKSILRLWVGVSPKNSGVRSAGNGPAMRSAIIGLYFADDPGLRREFVAASTRLTHTDPRAETAALAVAEAAVWIANPVGTKGEWLHQLTGLGTDMEWKSIVGQMKEALDAELSVMKFADRIRQTKGVSGFAYHTVPVALYAWLRHPSDFRTALDAALNCGGDTDTVGAIVGALVGAETGASAVPEEWQKKIWGPPRSMNFLHQLANRLNEQRGSGQALGPLKYFWPMVLIRNLVFLLTVLAHGFRRLLPPY